jgi:hypothetical protein
VGEGAGYGCGRRGRERDPRKRTHQPVRPLCCATLKRTAPQVGALLKPANHQGFVVILLLFPWSGEALVAGSVSQPCLERLDGRECASPFCQGCDKLAGSAGRRGGAQQPPSCAAAGVCGGVDNVPRRRPAGHLIPRSWSSLVDDCLSLSGSQLLATRHDATLARNADLQTVVQLGPTPSLTTTHHSPPLPTTTTRTLPHRNHSHQHVPRPTCNARLSQPISRMA